MVHPSSKEKLRQFGTIERVPKVVTPRSWHLIRACPLERVMPLIYENRMKSHIPLSARTSAPDLLIDLRNAPLTTLPKSLARLMNGHALSRGPASQTSWNRRACHHHIRIGVLPLALAIYRIQFRRRV